MRNCDQLHIREEYRNRTISSADIFNQINKKILFTAGASADMMNYYFGLYNVKTTDIIRYRYLAIKHVEIRHPIDRI
ncbi:hypothetical protein PRIPAC_72092 [Pristionchus pacificus]|uniref:Uncharacterized protein n=1 Tax=Pristionchus pacificus TaxID=54126 RepID=A0A2A6C091_PRIPA|nr:hypothetical protein PRIPAC_72092 [Pristionchus pacificus]|eukprot:PDM71672.1 hypothetical protein PRIPAC_38079 [Pristionchus pacificus]